MKYNGGNNNYIEYTQNIIWNVTRDNADEEHYNVVTSFFKISIIT